MQRCDQGDLEPLLPAALSCHVRAVVRNLDGSCGRRHTQARRRRRAARVAVPIAAINAVEDAAPLN